MSEGVLGVVLDAAQGANVRAVNLRVGDLQRMQPESFDLHWQVHAQDTPAAGAAVHITAIPVRIRCDLCRRESQLGDVTLLCPHCGSAQVEVLAGDELIVESVELADGQLVRNPTLADRAS
ncbi:MAG: hydrogenase maturation nickel metallochaperone HypA [Chloroflexota bacterium]